MDLNVKMTYGPSYVILVDFHPGCLLFLSYASLTMILLHFMDLNVQKTYGLI